VAGHYSGHLTTGHVVIIMFSKSLVIWANDLIAVEWCRALGFFIVNFSGSLLEVVKVNI